MASDWFNRTKINKNTGPGGWPRTVGHDPVNSNSNQRGEMNASLIILRDGAVLRSSVAAATPSQQRCAQHQLRRSSISSVVDATHRMSATVLVCAAPISPRVVNRFGFGVIG